MICELEGSSYLLQCVFITIMSGSSLCTVNNFYIFIVFIVCIFNVLIYCTTVYCTYNHVKLVFVKHVTSGGLYFNSFCYSVMNIYNIHDLQAIYFD